MSINPSNFLYNSSINDLGNTIVQQTINQFTTTFTFPSNTTTMNKQTIAFSNPIIITESQISAQMDGTPLYGDQVYTFGPAIQNRFVAMGSGTANGNAVFSNDGISLYPFPTVTSVYSAIGWSGTKWFGSILNSTNITAYYSYNGINWQSTTPNILSSTIVRPWKVYYNGIIYLMTFVNNPTNGNNIYYSYDGINWIIGGYSTTNVYSLAWNGVVWLAGSNGGGNTLAYSYDGINWNPSTNGTNNFSGFCRGTVWIGDKWVAVGNTSASNAQVAYTTDIIGNIGWTAVLNISTFTGSSSLVESICWNGKILCITNVGGTNLQAYSYDGVNWSKNSISNVFTSSGSTSASMAWNGRLFLAASPGATGNSLAYSYNGLNWRGLGSANLTATYSLGYSSTRPHSITFQKNLTVVSTDNGTFYSCDGINWTTISNITTSSNSVGYPYYNGKIWLCVTRPTASTSNLHISKDGINWSPVGTSTTFNFGIINNLYWSGSIWFITTTSSQNGLFYSYDGLTWIPINMSNIFSNYPICVSYNGSIYLAGGNGTGNTIAYSSNGINWVGSGLLSASNQVNCLYWANSIWIAGLSGSTNTLAYSYNGFNWIGLGNSIFSTQVNSIAYNGYIIIATGQGTNTNAYSYDGINWTVTSIFNTNAYGVTWNGTVWIASGSGANTIAYSYTGTNWTGLGTGTGTYGTNGWYNFSNYGIKPIPFIQHPTLALGYTSGSGSGNVTLAYSPDGITWSSLGNSTFSTQANCAFWNGSIWIAGGVDVAGTRNTLAYSYDGIQWTGINNVFTTAVTGIIYNGIGWVAVGTGGGNTVAYSLNGINWGGLNPSSFTGGGSVFWNGTVFLITGTSGTAYYSIDGAIWNQTSLSNAVGVPASNGYTWVCPISTSPGLSYITQSNPGLSTWTSISSPVFTGGNCVCYGGNIWLAGGTGGNALAYSYDAINWTGLQTSTTIFPNGCSSICWNGTRFVGAGGNYIGYSRDGIKWYSSQSLITTTNYVVSNPGIGAFVAPSAMVLNKYGFTGNGISASQNLEIISSDPYYQSGFDNVSITINSKYNQIIQYNYQTYQNNAMMNCCYSVRVIVPRYSGPVFNVTKSSDGTSSDFYTDSVQSYLTTGLNGSGTPFSTWSSGSTVYLNTWYDQSGKANNATQPTQSNKPTIVNSNGKYVVYFDNTSTRSFVSISTAINPSSILTDVYFSVNRGYSTIACNSINSDSGIRFGGGGSVNGDGNQYDWYNSSGLPKYAYVNGASSTTVPISSSSYSTIAFSVISSAFTIQLIGTDGSTTPNRGMIGYMPEFIMYNIPLQPSDLVIYNNNRLL